MWIGEFGEMENFRWNSLNNSGKGKWEYVWIGEFGEMENFRWNSLNNSGKGKWEYVWIGEFGEMENFRWNSLNNSGRKNIGEFGEIPHIVQLKEKGSMSGVGSLER